jgi:deoxyribonuclease-1
VRRLFGIALAACLSGPAAAESWNQTKNAADDIIHRGDRTEFYCGCEYLSHGDSDGSGDITSVVTCGYVAPQSHRRRAVVLEWEHVVPASLMPARQFPCWAGPGGSRQNCERNDIRAQAMIFELHNLVPSLGQVNALRGDDRYADLPDDTSDFGACPIEDSRGLFEPPDCKKGDVARIWLYMSLQHGVDVSEAERNMFLQWTHDDPVSRWEKRREARVAALTGIANPFVHGTRASRRGACPWE